MCASAADYAVKLKRIIIMNESINVCNNLSACVNNILR